MAYHTESIKRKNVYGNRSINISDGRQELVLSTVKHRKLSCFDHVCRIDCRKSYYKEQLMVVVAEKDCVKLMNGHQKGWTGQSMSSLQRIADDISRWTAITAGASVAVPNDA